jgi:DNA-binding NtrC family response regulator
MEINKKIVIVDDEELIRITLKDILENEGYEVEVSDNGEDGLEKIKEVKPFLSLIDIKMPKLDGINLLKKIKEIFPEQIVIIITAYGSIPSAVQAIKLGAYDYITKPFLPDDIINLINKAWEHYSLKIENIYLKEKLKERDHLEGIVGISEKMQKIYNLIETVAKTSATVLIYGETGTGKELVAQAIHNISDRKNKPFVKISCAGIPETLLETELFGYEKGAFTDAVSRKIGKFEIANKGTIFLDDIDDMPIPMQVKLLRVLQERKFERVGGLETIEVDVRFIAASKTPLFQLVRENKFREDLYYRLNIITINLPPLRERKEDIPVLVDYFLQRYNKKYKKNVKISEKTLFSLSQYDWPGNVRELENFIERLVVLSEREVVELENIEIINKDSFSIKPLNELLKETEREWILKVLKETGWKKGEAARILGISRKTLWEKIKEYKIDKI